MTIDRPSDLRALLAFYVDAGVDAVLDEGPVNRFTAEPSQPRPSQIPAGGPPSPYLPSQAKEGRVPTRAAFNRPGDIASNARSLPSPDRLDVPPSPDAAIMAARQAAAGATSLDALRSILERFEGCGLRFTAKRLVFADGNPQARVMFVGEAPGREEDIEGLPFVGRSGQLLDRMMAAIGLNRASAYIANVIPWRPPGNRTPTPQESQICLPFIKRQIELANPDVLVCLGNPSTQTLLSTREGIMKTRGRWLNYDTGTRSVRAMATFHPAYLLRSPAYKRMSWQDLRAIAKALHQ